MRKENHDYDKDSLNKTKKPNLQEQDLSEIPSKKYKLSEMLRPDGDETEDLDENDCRINN